MQIQKCIIIKKDAKQNIYIDNKNNNLFFMIYKIKKLSWKRISKYLRKDYKYIEMSHIFYHDLVESDDSKTKETVKKSLPS